MDDIPGQPTVKPPRSMWRMNRCPSTGPSFTTRSTTPPCKAARSRQYVRRWRWASTATTRGRARQLADDGDDLDKVRVPADIEPGEYVLSWRWDCELTAQGGTRAATSRFKA